MGEQELGKQVEATLERDNRVNLHVSELRVHTQDGGVVILEGEVDDLAAKRVAPLRAAAVPGVHRVVDRLAVRPAERMGDAAVRDHLRNALLSDTSFREFNLSVVDTGPAEAGTEERIEVVRDLGATARGDILIRVKEGVVELQGKVWSLSHRRLAEVLAWWVPGSVDVRNELRVEPDESDGDNEVADAVRLALEKDWLLNTDQIDVRAEDFRVVLAGTVPSPEQKSLAEHDAWCVPGVRGVENRLITP